MDAPVHVAFRREMDDGAGPVLRQQTVEQESIANVAVHEDVRRVVLQAAQILEIARVGQGVQVQDRLANGFQPVQDEVAADETGATCY